MEALIGSAAQGECGWWGDRCTAPPSRPTFGRPMPTRRDGRRCNKRDPGRTTSEAWGYFYIWQLL